MTNQDEWFYREPSDPPDSGSASAEDSRVWTYQEPGDPRARPPRSSDGDQNWANQPLTDWAREYERPQQPARERWAEPEYRQPTAPAARRYDSPPPRTGQAPWEMPSTRDQQAAFTETYQRPEYRAPTRDYRPPAPPGRPPARENRPPVPPGRPPAREPRVPDRAERAPVSSPWWMWGLVSLSAALGLLLDAYAVAHGVVNNNLATELFWPAIALPTVVFATVLLSRRLSRPLRHVTIALIGVYSALMYRMSGLMQMSSFDEHLHVRTLSDMLLGSGLFAQNPLLTVSPNYPGLELFTGTEIRLTGLPLMVGAGLAIVIFRYLLVLAIYECARTVNASPRFASLVVLLYATSPQFFFFNSIFAYQSAALPLGIAGLLLVRRAQLSSGRAARLQVATGILVLAATVVTHHITSWFVFAFLIGWTILTPRAGRRQLTIASLGMGAALVVWTGTVFGKMLSYLGPEIIETFQQAAGLIGGSSSSPPRQVLGGTAGYVTPEYQKATLVLYALIYTGAAVVCGFILIRRSFGGRGRVLGFVGFITICYPVTLVMHFLPNAASIGDRASTFLFLPLALAVALVIVRDPRVAGKPRRLPPGAPVGARVYGLFAAFIAFAYLGGIFLGAGPSSGLLPGPYLVVSDSRSQDPDTLAAVQWAAGHIQPGSQVIADRDSGNLLAANARLWPLMGPEDGVEYAEIYFNSTWTATDTDMLRQLHISYIYVDERLSEALPQEGYYIYQGETPNPVQLTKQDLTKFASVRGLTAVYQRGPIAIYSTAGLGVTAQTDGYSGYRHMGFGTVGDVVFGALVVLCLYLLRRRLRWVTELWRLAGPVGWISAAVAAVIFVGFPLFGLDLEPGPGFTVGAGITALILYVVSRVRGGGRQVPPAHGPVRINPLVVLAVLIAAVAIAISYRSAWVLDVADVNNILHAIH